MDLESGYPYWTVKNGLLAVYPPLKEAERCEVAILGGGITGALIADHLSSAGIDVMVLDKRECGWGSTSASTALLQYEIDVPLYELIELRGQDFAERAYKLCLGAVHKIAALIEGLEEDCDFSWKRSLYIAKYKKDVKALEQEFAARQAAGFRIAFLTEDEIGQDFSFRRPAGLLSEDAAQMDAYRVAHALLRRAVSRGTRVYDRTEAIKFEPMRGGVRLETNRGTTVTAKKVVFATGFESQQFLSEQVVDLISTYAIISAPMNLSTGWGHNQCLIWEYGDPYLYMRTTDDGRAIVGGEDVPFQDARRRDRLITKKSQTLAKKFIQMFPHLPFETEYAWTGTFGTTEDGLAYIGETPEFPNAYFALGYGGNGITYSVVAAELIRDLYFGYDNPDVEIFRFGR